MYMDGIFGAIPNLLMMLKPGMKYYMHTGVASNNNLYTLDTPASTEFAIVLPNGALWHPILIIPQSNVNFMSASESSHYSLNDFWPNVYTAQLVITWRNNQIQISINNANVSIGIVVIEFR